MEKNNKNTRSTKLLAKTISDLIRRLNMGNGYIQCNHATCNKLLDEIQLIMPNNFHDVIRGGLIKTEDGETKSVKCIIFWGIPYWIFEREDMSDDAFVFQPENYPLKFIYKNFGL